MWHIAMAAEQPFTGSDADIVFDHMPINRPAMNPRSTVIFWPYPHVKAGCLSRVPDEQSNHASQEKYSGKYQDAVPIALPLSVSPKLKCGETDKCGCGPEIGSPKVT